VVAASGRELRGGNSPNLLQDILFEVVSYHIYDHLLGWSLWIGQRFAERDQKEKGQRGGGADRKRSPGARPITHPSHEFKGLRRAI